METTVKPLRLKLDQQFEIVKELKKRHPDWQFDRCPICGDWGAVFEQYHGAHPMCWENHPTKRKRIVNRNQGQLLPNDSSDETV